MLCQDFNFLFNLATYCRILVDEGPPIISVHMTAGQKYVQYENLGGLCDAA